MQTEQEKFWSNNFGKEYSDRNSWQTDEDWDLFYKNTWGKTKIEINELVMSLLPKETRILEVGCNIGQQLRGYQRMGFTNLYGVELQQYAVEKAKQNTIGINIIQGSGFDLPFKDGYFDLVCTNGVLIHISPNDHNGFMSEVIRCSSKYVMGWEYYADSISDINYRGNIGYLWKANFAQIYQDLDNNLSKTMASKVPYLNEVGNVDEIFLLNKIIK